MYYFIDLLKALASILITNSHLGNMYPSEFMALGGSFGNGLFFCISGFLLIHIKKKFVPWYLGKAKRIYPTVFAGAVLLLLFGRIGVKGIVDVLRYFIYPTNWWFVAAILVFYIAYYFIVVKQKQSIISASMIAVVVFYFAVYFICMDLHTFCVEGKDFSLFKWIYYFFIMLMGAYIRNKDYNTEKKWSFLIIAFLSVLFWGVLRVLFMIYPVLLPLQFLTQFMVVVFVYHMMRFGIAMENEDAFHKICNLKIVKILSKITLEVYIVQAVVLPFCEKIQFPVNIIVAYLGVFISAFVLHYIVNIKALINGFQTAKEK